MSKKDKLTCISDVIARTDELPQEIMDLLMKAESIIADLEMESTLHPECDSPSTIPINPNMQEHIALDFQDNTFIVNELQNSNCNISVCASSLSPRNDERETLAPNLSDKEFDVPLLNDTGYSHSIKIRKESESLSENSNDNEAKPVGANDVQKEDANFNSDSTIEYSLDNINEWTEVNKEDKRITPPGMQSFSPLPSTSRDYAIMNINDMMFNGSEEIKQETNSSKEFRSKRCINRKNRPVPEDLNIVECSSGSENADDEVIICNEIKPSIIDLSLDDAKYDSDCEIVDVDSILDINKKVLNTTEINPPTLQNDQIGLVDLNQSVKIMSSNTEAIAMPIQLPGTPDVEVIQDMERLDSSTPLPNNYFPILNDLNTFLNSKADNPTDLEDAYNNMLQCNSDNILQHNLGNVLQNTLCDNNFSSLYPYVNSFPDEVRRRKLKKRTEHNMVKRRRIVPVIDLSVTSSTAHNSSDVVIIDADSPLNFQSSSNLAQISVSIVTQTPCSTNLASDHFPEQSAHIPNAIQSSAPISVPSNPMISNLSNESSCKTPPRGLGDCPVCLENFSKVKAVSTFCGHLFCLDCITTVKNTSKKCPTCRKHLKGKGYHPIFL